MALLTAALSVAGTVISAIGAIQQGQAAKSAAEFEAAQLKQKAQVERAAGQRKAFAERRKGDLAQSTLLARAAAGGAGAADPTIINLGAGIEEESELQAYNEFFIANNRAAGMEDQAKAAIMTGKAKQAQGYATALGGVLSGGMSAYEKYAALSSKYG